MADIPYSQLEMLGLVTRGSYSGGPAPTEEPATVVEVAPVESVVDEWLLQNMGPVASTPPPNEQGLIDNPPGTGLPNLSYQTNAEGTGRVSPSLQNAPNLRPGEQVDSYKDAQDILANGGTTQDVQTMLMKKYGYNESGAADIASAYGMTDISSVAEAQRQQTFGPATLPGVIAAKASALDAQTTRDVLTKSGALDRTGSLDLVKALNSGVGESSLRNLGIEQSDIDSAKSYMSSSTSLQSQNADRAIMLDVLQKTNSVDSSGNIDLVRALSLGVRPDMLLSSGMVLDTDIKSAQASLRSLKPLMAVPMAYDANTGKWDTEILQTALAAGTITKTQLTNAGFTVTEPALTSIGRSSGLPFENVLAKAMQGKGAGVPESVYESMVSQGKQTGRFQVEELGAGQEGQYKVIDTRNQGFQVGPNFMSAKEAMDYASTQKEPSLWQRITSSDITQTPLGKVLIGQNMGALTSRDIMSLSGLPQIVSGVRGKDVFTGEKLSTIQGIQTGLSGLSYAATIGMGAYAATRPTIQFTPEGYRVAQEQIAKETTPISRVASAVGETGIPYKLFGTKGPEGGSSGLLSKPISLVKSSLGAVKEGFGTVAGATRIGLGLSLPERINLSKPGPPEATYLDAAGRWSLMTSGSPGTIKIPQSPIEIVSVRESPLSPGQSRGGLAVLEKVVTKIQVAPMEVPITGAAREFFPTRSAFPGVSNISRPSASIRVSPSYSPGSLMSLGRMTAWQASQQTQTEEGLVRAVSPSVDLMARTLGSPVINPSAPIISPATKPTVGPLIGPGISSVVSPGAVPLIVPGISPFITPGIGVVTQPVSVTDMVTRITNLTTPAPIVDITTMPTVRPTTATVTPSQPVTEIATVPPGRVTVTPPKEPGTSGGPGVPFAGIKFPGLGGGGGGGGGGPWMKGGPVGRWNIRGMPVYAPHPLTGQMTGSQIGKRSLKYGIVESKSSKATPTAPRKFKFTYGMV